MLGVAAGIPQGFLLILTGIVTIQNEAHHVQLVLRDFGLASQARLGRRTGLLSELLLAGLLSLGSESTTVSRDLLLLARVGRIYLGRHDCLCHRQWQVQIGCVHVRDPVEKHFLVFFLLFVPLVGRSHARASQFGDLNFVRIQI